MGWERDHEVSAHRIPRAQARRARARSQALTPKLETRNSKPETRNSKPETRDWFGAQLSTLNSQLPLLTRPLDLSRRLRPHPRSFDWVYVVNVGLIAGFFAFFGSRFVVSPGLGVDFQLPEVPGASADARVTTHVITIVNAGQIVVDDGLRNLDQLALWLEEQSKAERRPSLLVRASAEVPAATLARILGLAHTAGFQVTVAAEDHPRRGAPPSAR